MFKKGEWLNCACSVKNAVTRLSDFSWQWQSRNDALVTAAPTPLRNHLTKEVWCIFGTQCPEPQQQMRLRSSEAEFPSCNSKSFHCPKSHARKIRVRRRRVNERSFIRWIVRRLLYRIGVRLRIVLWVLAWLDWFGRLGASSRDLDMPIDASRVRPAISGAPLRVISTGRRLESSLSGPEPNLHHCER
jgi:hypothetical protein